MNRAGRTETWNLPVEAVYRTIVDYASYPEFVEGVDEVEVLEQGEEGAKVCYSLNLIKKFSYTLRLTHERNKSVRWTLESGTLFKANDGGWELEDLGGGNTRVAYEIELRLKGLVPGRLVDKLAGGRLPAVMRSFRERAARTESP